jgi:hypothetical protein
MRRALASLLLAVFSFPLIAPALLGNTDSDLPSCCLRGGRHHCVMANIADPAAGVEIRAIQPKCPLFPKAGAAAVFFHTALPGSVPRIAARLVLRSVNRKTAKNLPQTALRGSIHKRGPPSNLS